MPYSLSSLPLDFVLTKLFWGFYENSCISGKYAMRDLVQKLPSGNTHDSGTSDETIAAVLATLNEVIKKSAEFSRSLLDVGGVERLVNMTRHRGRYSVRVVKFASQVSQQ